MNADLMHATRVRPAEDDACFPVERHPLELGAAILAFGRDPADADLEADHLNGLLTNDRFAGIQNEISISVRIKNSTGIQFGRRRAVVQTVAWRDPDGARVREITSETRPRLGTRTPWRRAASVSAVPWRAPSPGYVRTAVGRM